MNVDWDTVLNVVILVVVISNFILSRPRRQDEEGEIEDEGGEFEGGADDFQERTLDNIVEAVDNIDFQPLVNLFAQKGWADERIRVAVRDLQKFLVVRALWPDLTPFRQMVPISRDSAEMWIAYQEELGEQFLDDMDWLFDELPKISSFDLNGHPLAVKTSDLVGEIFYSSSTPDRTLVDDVKTPFAIDKKIFDYNGAEILIIICHNLRQFPRF